MGLSLRSLWDSRARGISAVFIGILLVFAVTAATFAGELIKVEDALKKAFPAAGYFERRVIPLSGEQVHQLEEAAHLTFAGKHSDQIIVHIAREQNAVAGYAFEDTVIGKWGPIHYLVGLDIDGAVSQVIILDYQEIRGRPIAKPRFLRQYQGKTVRDTLQLRKDIDGITGATVSSASLTEGVRKILHVYELIKSGLH